MMRDDMQRRPARGHLAGGLPFARVGQGPRPLIAILGLLLENRPPPAFAVAMYRFLGRDFTVYAVMRRPALRSGTTIADLAADHAAMIREEFGGPVDVIGTSTGGSIALQLAADHPAVLRRVVVHSSAHELSEPGKRWQLVLARRAKQRRWRAVWAQLMSVVLPQRGPAWALTRPVVWTFEPLMALGAPRDPSDLVITVEAEDRFGIRDRLGEISAPTLVVAGERDTFYTPDLFRETAAGIPHGELRLYPDMGHPAQGRRFELDVLAFLHDDGPPSAPAGTPTLGARRHR
jgi:pimeloyl-ACP methyl ester carboxylesterase